MKIPYTYELRGAIREAAKKRKAIKAAYALNHNSTGFEEARDVLGARSRGDGREWLTALHIVLAEVRGKAHCDAEKWIKSLPWNVKGAKLIEEARKLLPVDIAVPAV